MKHVICRCHVIVCKIIIHADLLVGYNEGDESWNSVVRRSGFDFIPCHVCRDRKFVTFKNVDCTPLIYRSMPADGNCKL
jgi:hypothetical protein